MPSRRRAPSDDGVVELVGARAAGGPRVAYLMSRFPKITETFVLYEMRALESLGASVEVFPLLRQPDGPRHPEALPYEARAHFVGLLSPRLIAANWRRMVTDPRAYFGTWWHAVRGTWGSLNFLLGAIAYFPKSVWFAECAERLGVQHIHAHFANHPALAALMVHRLTGIPYSFTAHGSDLHVNRRMLREKVAAAAFVVAISAYNRALIVGESDPRDAHKVVVIHCGTDPDVFAARNGDVRHVNGDGSRGLRLACVASFEEVKGHRYLLQACKMLMDRGIPIELALAGGGPLRGEIERLITELGLRASVTVHGPVPRAEVRRILADSDVAVLASTPTKSGRREGIPVALMEAMMSGLPVVASAISGIPELVEEGRTGHLVPPGDPWSLSRRLESLAQSRALRERMGAAGRAKVLAEFDVLASARSLLNAIRGVESLARKRDS